jgi:hypothetical protein
MRNEFPPELKELVKADWYLSKVGASLTVKALTWDKNNMPDAAYVNRALAARVTEIRNGWHKDIVNASKHIPIVHSATGVQGVGIRLLMRVLIYVNIEKADTVAALWTYCGFGITRGVIDTVATVRWPGSVAYNSMVRGAVTEVRRNLSRWHSPYRTNYADRMAYEIERGVSKPLAVRRAQRYVAKLWLKHLWRVWRIQEGLPLTEPAEGDDTALAVPFGWR